MTDKKQPEALTQARLKELFDYRDGQLINKTIRRSRVSAGKTFWSICMTKQNNALRLADALAYCDASVASQAAAELRCLHAENTALQAGYSAARLEIESLKAQSADAMHGEHAELRRLSDCCPELNLSNYGPDDVDELNGWAIEVSQCIDHALAAQPAGAQQPGAAYAAVTDERAAFEAMMRSQTFDSLKRLSDGSYESYEARVGWMAWNVRASHGQAPASKIEMLTATQEPLGAEFEKVLHDNLFDLYEESAPHGQAPAQAAPAAVAPNWTDAANWLRNNYQDYPNIASLCEGMIAASPLATSTGTPPINWENAMPGGKYTDKWESSRVADYNRGWNDYRKESHKKLKELTAATTARAAPQQEAQEPSHRETVDVVGVRSNGEHVNLEKIAMPPRMKAREIAIEQFGSFKDDDGSDAEMCFGALEYFLEWLIQQGWSKAPQPAPAAQGCSLDVVLDAFENKTRGIPQAHIAAALVAELRAAIEAARAAQEGK